VVKWRKSSKSGSQTNCVELSNAGLVRDSKNPSTRLRVDLAGLLAFVKLNG
jgi:hypothetical protein